MMSLYYGSFNEFSDLVLGSNILVSTVEKAVQIAPYKDQILLPCSVSDPTAVVNLYKGNHK
ncbi:unnamed protein product, partial [Allacma fusca]